jgi:Transposase and inactivated derivatives
MPRTARIAPKEFVYHTLTRGNNRQAIFKDEEDYQKYIDILKKYREKYHFRLYHYVLMTNHVHLVIETTDEGGELSQIMKGINLSYAQYFKTKYKHIGHFWQDSYKSILIAKDEYLLACGCYVELNPIRAGIVKEPKDYRWSSYHANAYGKRDILMDEHVIYDGLSSDEAVRKEYRKFVKEMLQKNEVMRREMEKRLIYGGSDFIQRVNKKFKMEALIKSMGRPKKEPAEKQK